MVTTKKLFNSFPATKKKQQKGVNEQNSNNKKMKIK